MKQVILVKPSFEDLWFRKECMEDPETMSYNAGYDVSYFGYHYDTGCIDFPKERWKAWYEKSMNNPEIFYAYIKDVETNTFVGYINFHKTGDYYSMGVLVNSKFRGQGYMRPALRELFKEAKKRKIDALYDSVPFSRKNALKVFLDEGFEIVETAISTKFGKDDEVAIIRKFIK